MAIIYSKEKQLSWYSFGDGAGKEAEKERDWEENEKDKKNWEKEQWKGGKN